MSALFPLLAALLQASSLTLDKAILSIRRMSYQTYVGFSFPLTFFILLIVFAVVHTPFPDGFLTGVLGLFLLITIGFTVGTNLIYYRALATDRLSELELFSLLNQIPVIIVTGILFADERKLGLLIPALIASAAIIWSHWSGKKIKIHRGTLMFLLWSLIASPIYAGILKKLLEVWNPVSLELFRSGAVALIFSYLFFRHGRYLPPKSVPLLFLTNILSAFAWLFFLWSYQRSGVVYTVLLFSMQPLLVYVGALFYLRERFHWKKAIAFGIVLLSIGAAQWYRMH